MAKSKDARVELTADDRSFSRVLKDAQKKWAAFGKQVGKGFGTSFKGLAGGLGRGATRALGFGGVAGVGALVGSEVQKTFKFEEALTRVKIASRGALGDLGAFREQVFAVSNATGLAREEVLAAASAYLALTGDANTAAGSMELFAKVQRASGASMDDIAKSAAALTQNLKINPADFERAFSILIAGGKAGSVELKDMAGLMAGLAPLAERFAGGSGTTGLANLGAALQLTRQGFGSAEEAATGLSSLMGAIVQHAGKLEAAGVKVFTKDANGVKQLRSFQEIVDSIGNSKLAKDPTKLTKALGRKEALAAFIQLTKVDGAWDDLSRSTESANDVAEDYATFQQSSAGNLQKAWNDVKNAIAGALTPERIEAFVGFLRTAIEVAGKLVDTMSRIPGYIEFLQGEGEVARADEDDALDDILLKKKLGAAEIAKMTPQQLLAHENEGRSEVQRRIAGASGDDRERREMAIRAAKRRVALDAKIDRQDQLKGQGRHRIDDTPRMSPDFYENEGFWKKGQRRASEMHLRITMDPSTQNLGAKLDNAPHLAVSP